YGWYLTNSGQTMHPVGQAKPNDLGLFDALGNANEWCTDAYAKYEPEKYDTATAQRTANAIILNDAPHVQRGGAFDVAAENLRSAVRYMDRPADRFHTNGIRPARTYP